MKKLFLLLTLAGVLGAGSERAQTPATPAPAASPTAVATPAAGPTESERLDAIEAYYQNTDPSIAFKAHKDKDGNLPKDFKAGTLSVPGPGHNGWMMTSVLFVLFLLLFCLFLFFCVFVC